VSELPVVRRYERAAFQALDGQRVRAEGLYEKTAVTKRPGGAGEPDLGRPGCVALRLGEDRYALMLGVYYRPEGTRPVEEVQRFHGRRVAVVGTLHAFTPTHYAPGGIPMQTMTNAYLGEVESIERLDE